MVQATATILREARAKESERRVVRAEEKGIAASDIQQIRQAIIAATADIRQKMTEKFRCSFDIFMTGELR